MLPNFNFCDYIILEMTKNVHCNKKKTQPHFVHPTMYHLSVGCALLASQNDFRIRHKAIEGLLACFEQL